MNIRACPACGSLSLSFIGGGANAIFDFTGVSALSGMSHCEKCNRDVLPIEFKSEKEYAGFVELLKESASEQAAQTGKSAQAKNSERAPPPSQIPLAKSDGPNLAQGRVSTYIAGSLVLVAFSTFLLSLSIGSMIGLLVASAIFCIAAYLFMRKKQLPIQLR